MAMSPCVDCGTEVSLEAESCPQCGRPNPHLADEELTTAMKVAAAEENKEWWQDSGCGCLGGVLVVFFLLWKAFRDGFFG